MIKKLRRKFIIIAMCSVFAVLAVIIGTINIVNYVNVVKNADSLVELLKDGGGGFDGNFGEGGDFSGRPPMPMSPETPFQTRFFTVEFNGEGQVVSVNVDRIAAVDQAEATEYAESLYKKSQTSGFVGNYRYGVTSTSLGGKMYIFVDCTRELSDFNSFLLVSLAVSAGGLALVFILVFFLSGKILKPVAESYKKQKQFITDASHEIKTPLTIIGANADVLEMQNGENEWTAGIKSEVRRLAALTDKLVFLARMDEESQVLKMMDFSLSDAVEESVKPFEAVALSRGSELQIDIQPNLSYCGDEAMIRQLVNLLVDNAIKYSDEGKNIVVRLNSIGTKIQFMVQNSNSALSEKDMNVLFERFYRSDKSRNSETGGHGVGLSVAQSIVTAHKGKIKAETQNGIVTFTVIL